MTDMMRRDFWDYAYHRWADRDAFLADAEARGWKDGMPPPDVIASVTVLNGDGSAWLPPVRTGTDKDGMPTYEPPVRFEGYHVNIAWHVDAAPKIGEFGRIARPRNPLLTWGEGT